MMYITWILACQLFALFVIYIYIYIYIYIKNNDVAGLHQPARRAQLVGAGPRVSKYFKLFSYLLFILNYFNIYIYIYIYNPAGLHQPAGRAQLVGAGQGDPRRPGPGRRRLLQARLPRRRRRRRAPLRHREAGARDLGDARARARPPAAAHAHALARAKNNTPTHGRARTGARTLTHAPCRRTRRRRACRRRHWRTCGRATRTPCAPSGTGRR